MKVDWGALPASSLILTSRSTVRSVAADVTSVRVRPQFFQFLLARFVKFV